MDNHETLSSSDSSPTPSTSSATPLIQRNTTSANHERVGTVSSNGAAYASVTINNNDTTTPVNPPTGVQPVMYSNIAGDITKVFISLYFFIILSTCIILERSCHCLSV